MNGDYCYSGTEDSCCYGAAVRFPALPYSSLPPQYPEHLHLALL